MALSPDTGLAAELAARGIDPAAAQAAAARVSPGGATILDAAGDRMQVLWGATPHFYQKGPFLVIFVGDNPAVRETLTRAFGPQFAGG